MVQVVPKGKRWCPWCNLIVKKRQYARHVWRVHGVDVRDLPPGTG